MKAENLIGQKFYRLKVVERVGSKGGKALWKCECECGTITFVKSDNLKRGNTKSCGCLWKNKITKHGLYKTKLYKTWANMKSRCINPTVPKYKIYGARGIKVCKEWLTFSQFAEWAIKNGYNEQHKRGEYTLDRIDVNGDYEPKNCRWISNKKQQNNRRNNRIIKYKGITHTLKEWSEILNISYKTLEYRLDAGWDIKTAFYKPTKKHQKEGA